MLNKVTTEEVIKAFISDYNKIKVELKDLLLNNGYRWSSHSYHPSLSGSEGLWINYRTRTSLRIRWGKVNSSAILYIEIAIDNELVDKIVKFFETSEVVNRISSPDEDYDLLNSKSEVKKEIKKEWCCWTLDREEIERVVIEICGNVKAVNEDEIEQIVEDFKDAISIAFEEWEEALKEIVQNVKGCQNEV